MKRRKFVMSGLAGTAAFIGAGRAIAQERLVRLIVPFAVGGSTDIAARALAEHMRRLTGQTYVVENKPGGAGKVGNDLALAARPDGRTLLVNVASNYSLVPHTQKDPAQRAFTNFIPVSALSVLDFALYVRPSVPVKTVAEFIALVRKDPQVGFYSTSAVGNISHFYGIMLASAAKLKMQDVPYQGGGPALLAVIAGHVPAGMGSVSTPLIQAHNDGRVRVLAMMSPKRSPFLSNVPTMTESGLPEIALSDWIGVFAPPGTPAAAVESINALVSEVHRQPEFGAALTQIMLQPLVAGPSECAASLQRDFDIWQPIVKASGFIGG